MRANRAKKLFLRMWREKKDERVKKKKNKQPSRIRNEEGQNSRIAFVKVGHIFHEYYTLSPLSLSLFSCLYNTYIYVHISHISFYYYVSYIYILCILYIYFFFCTVLSSSLLRVIKLTKRCLNPICLPFFPFKFYDTTCIFSLYVNKQQIKIVAQD